MRWQQDAVVYQIYPRSFQDSGGDGIGDLPGIIRRLDYLQALGVTVLWLSPIYDSPNDDGGYDIRDYRAILADFGTLADFDRLVQEAHRRGLKIMMDLVVNHTSDEHPWFVDARTDPASPTRDYYLWHPGVAGERPNNWKSFFDGHAWNRPGDEGDFYLHLFSPRQPDLNWKNPQVRRDIHDMMRWWLDRGVDGFRMDAISYLGKPDDFPEGDPLPGSPLTSGVHHYRNRPEVHTYLREMHDEVLSAYDVLTVGEMGSLTPEEALTFVADERRELQSLFQFDHLELMFSPHGANEVLPLDLPKLKRALDRWQTGLHGRGWNTLFWGNHDLPRAVSLFGHDGEFRVPSAKLLATTLLFLQGTPYLYQGEEIGMTNAGFGRLEEYRDTAALRSYHAMTGTLGLSAEVALAALRGRSRDNSRTPMQWDATANAGFSTGTPWIAVNPNFREINVAAQQADPTSVLRHYQHVIALRKSEDVVRDGTFRLLDPDHATVFAYLRENADTRLLVVSHFSTRPGTYALPEGFAVPGAQVISDNDPSPPLDLQPVISLRPYQSVVIRVSR